jgi:small-conductance mechanosensitive channel
LRRAFAARLRAGSKRARAMNRGEQLAAWIPWMPDWLLGLLLFALIIASGFALQSIAVHLLSRVVARQKLAIPELFRRVRGIIRMAIVLCAAALAFPIIPMAAALSDMLHSLLIAATIVLSGWILIIAVNWWADRYIGRLNIGIADNLQARKVATQMRVLVRAADTLLIVLTIAFALMSFPSVQRFGMSLFASAGVAGLFVGLAARPVLENLFAGMQLAMTQPIRIDDVLVVQGQWGWVEEINSTYVVMRLWDWRRFVLPLNYFLQQPFENWTRTGAAIIGSVLLYLDYTAPVEAIRARATEIVKDSDRWDGNVVNVQVTDAKQDTIEVRILMSAASSPVAWDLRCEVREKILAYIQSEFPSALPRRRATIAGTLDSGADAGRVDRAAASLPPVRGRTADPGRC